MYDIMYDIMVLHLWYHSQYLWYPYLISCMISHMISWPCIYDIKIIWYHSSMISEHISQLSCPISEKSSMIAYMMTRWLYPLLKTRCIERCRSRALQVQAQDVQSRRLWLSALLNEALLVLVVKRFLMLANASWAFSCKPMQRAAWRDNLLPWCCTQGRRSWSWTNHLQEFTNQLGTPTRYRVT